MVPIRQVEHCFALCRNAGGEHDWKNRFSVNQSIESLSVASVPESLPVPPHSGHFSLRQVIAPEGSLDGISTETRPLPSQYGHIFPSPILMSQFLRTDEARNDSFEQPINGDLRNLDFHCNFRTRPLRHIPRRCILLKSLLARSPDFHIGQFERGSACVVRPPNPFHRCPGNNLVHLTGRADRSAIRDTIEARTTTTEASAEMFR